MNSTKNNSKKLDLSTSELEKNQSIKYFPKNSMEWNETQ